MDKSASHKKQRTNEAFAELEARLRTYQELDRHTQAAYADLQRKLAEEKISKSLYDRQRAKLFEGQTAEERFAYYAGQIKQYEERIQRLQSQQAASAKTDSVLSFNKISLSVLVACVLVTLLLALPYLANIKGYAVYEKNYAIAHVNTFVPAGSILTLRAGGTSTSVLVDALNVTSIMSVYNHQIMNGYYLEELKLDVTELPLENDTIGTIQVMYNNSLIVEVSAIITGKVNTQNASETVLSLPTILPESVGSPLLPPIVVEDHKNQTIMGNASAINASNVSISGIIEATNATQLTASLDKSLYLLGEPVIMRLLPENASYSGVLIDPRGKPSVLENLTFYPKRAGDYTINLLLYTNETEKRLSLEFGVITNITQLLGNLTIGNTTNISASLKRNLPNTLVKAADGFRIRGLKLDEDIVLKTDPSERATLHKYKGRAEFLLKKNNEYVGVLDLDLDQDVDLSAIRVEFNRTLKSAAIHVNSSIPSLVRRTILAPRGQNDHMVYLCPFARTIAEGDKNCPGFTLFSDRQRIGDMFAQKVEIDGQLYFEIANVTGTDVSTNVTCGVTVFNDIILGVNLTQSGGGVCITLGADGIDFNCAYNYLNETGTGTSGVGFYAGNKSNIVIANCTIIGFQNAIQFNGSINHSVIEHNNLSWNRFGVQNTLSGQTFLNSSIRYNIFNSSSDDDIDLMLARNSNITENNFSFGTSVACRTCHNVTIDHNIFFNMTRNGFRCSTACSNLTLNGNVFHGIMPAINGTVTMRDWVIERNMFNLTSGIAMTLRAPVGSPRLNGTIQHNVIGGNGLEVGINIHSAATSLPFFNNLTVFNNTFNTTKYDVFIGDLSSSGNRVVAEGPIIFHNNTIFSPPKIYIKNISVNITFFNTNFSVPGVIDVVYPRFNLTPIIANTSLNISYFNFWINGTVSDYAIVGVNVSNISDLNRSANVTIYNINCSAGYRLYYNETLIPFIDTLNQSFVVANQNIPAGDACATPATCQNVVCTGGNGGRLTFDITQFSSFGAQNFDAGTACGTTITSSTTLSSDISTTSGTCITFGADNIFLNCAGFTVSGNGAGTRGIIAENRTGLRIENCTLRNFATALEFTQNVNHSQIARNTFINDTNATIILGDDSLIATSRFTNLSVIFNTFNGTSNRFRPNDVVELNLTNNNFTGSSIILGITNSTIEKNYFRNLAISFSIIGGAREGSIAKNTFLRENTFVNSSDVIIEISSGYSNITLIDINVSSNRSSPTPCLQIDGSTNGTFINFRCETDDSVGIRFGPASGSGFSGSPFLNFTNTFLNANGREILMLSRNQRNVSGIITFVNLTIADMPFIEIINTSINMTFNNTNFTSTNVSLFYPYFNISTNLSSGSTVVINRTYLYVNGSALGEFGVVALNATNLTLLNRSADVYVAGVDCSGFRITYNESFVPFIDTLNQSLDVANQFASSGGSCASPSSCTNVRCENSMLTFNITQFSSYGVQNQPGNLTGCGATLRFNTTLTNTLTQATAGQCLTLNASGMYLNCNGMELIGNGTGTRGIVADNRTGLRIENCTVRNFATAVEFTSGVNHSIISRNTLINNTNGTILNVGESSTLQNITINFNFVNGTSANSLRADSIANLNVSFNNFTTTTPNSAFIIRLSPNVTVENNQISGPTDALVRFGPTLLGTFTALRNTINSTSGRALLFNTIISNFTIRDMNITGSSSATTCMEFSTFINGSMTNMRCEGANDGISIGSSGVAQTGEYFINFTNSFFDVGGLDIRRNGLIQSNFTGLLSFLNTTFVANPAIQLINTSINITFNNTNFTQPSITIIYPFFNISTNPVDKTSFSLNLSNFIINASSDFGLIAINATNLTELNRSANASIVNINCSAGYRLYYNQSFVPFIDTLNQSLVAADQDTPAGGVCDSPATCSNVRCTGGNGGTLTFDIDQFSSFGAQNFDAQVTCGSTITSSTTLNANLNTTSGNCLTFGADNIFLNCNGNTLTGNGTGTRGIVADNRTGLRIENCTLRNFATAIEFTRNVNHSQIARSTLINNTNSTIISHDVFDVDSFNLTIIFNTFNGTGNSLFRFVDVRLFNLTNNNFTGVRTIAAVNNATVEKNSFKNISNEGLQLSGVSGGSGAFLNENTFEDIGSDAIDIRALITNFTMLNTNVSSSVDCFNMDGPTNGTVNNLRCDTSANGIYFGTINSNSGIFSTLFLNLTNIFINSSTEIFSSSNTQDNASGIISFVNLTLVTMPVIQIMNVSLNITFNNTNFTDGNASLFYPYFNISTNLSSGSTVVINRTYLYVNGSALGEFGVVALNATNLTLLNRSADVYVAGVDCSGFRITYNESFVPFIDTLNQSLDVANQFASSGDSCASPSSCTNVRCSNEMLTFNITQFSSYGVQNQPGNLTGCGVTLRFNTTLTNTLTQATAGQCLTLNASGMYLNCNGMELIGNGTGTRGIVADNRTGLRIENCTLRNFATAIEFTRNVNHSQIARNTLINNTNSTIIGHNSFSESSINLTVIFNTFNGTSDSGDSAFDSRQVRGFNLTNNNFTDMSSLVSADNATIERNRFGSGSTGLSLSGASAGNSVYFRETVFTGASDSFIITGGISNLTVIDTNISSGACLQIDGPTNGTFVNTRCSGTFTGVQLGTTSGIFSTLFINFTNLFVNASNREIFALSTAQDNVSGLIGFINTTLVTRPVIEIINISINMTFNNTNFTDGNASLFYPYFNISTNLSSGSTVVINRTYLYVNGSALGEFGVVALNATNLTLLNRSADVYVAGVDCSGFRITYNESFVPFIDTLNQSFEAADQFTASGGACSSPSSCSNVRCANEMLTFNITQFSSYGVQNQPGNLTGCGATLRFNTTLTNNLEQSGGGACLTIGADGLILDCNQMILNETDAGINGVAVHSTNRVNIVVANCTIIGFQTAIQFNGSNNNTLVQQNNLSWDGFGVFHSNNTHRNSVIRWNRFNSTEIAMQEGNSTNITVFENNLTSDDVGVRFNAQGSTNVTIQGNRFSGIVTASIFSTVKIDNWSIFSNTFNDVPVRGVGFFGGDGLTIAQNTFNMTGGIAIRLVGPANGSFRHNVFQGMTTGLNFFSFSGDILNLTVLNNTINATGSDVYFGDATSTGNTEFTIGGTISFVNTTLLSPAALRFINTTTNATFNNTHFNQSGIVDLLYPYFNVSLLTTSTLVINNTLNFNVNGSSSDFAIIALNATNASVLNRSANVTIPNINCTAGYRLYYNETFVPFIDTLNQSFVAANQDTTAGAACTSPATCSNVRCTGGNGGTLTFDITQFSSFAAQSVDAGISCGDTLTSSTTLNANLNTTNGACLTIGADNIFLNCNGSIIAGNGTGTRGIVMANRTGIRVENCTIRDFATGIELTQNVTHTVMNRNTLVNNTNGTIIKAKDSFADSFTNITITFSHINLSATRGIRAIGVDSLNISVNNFTRAIVQFDSNNVMMERNQLNATTDDEGVTISATSRNVQLLRNTFGTLREGILAAGNLDNITISDTNMTGSVTCFILDLPINATLNNLRCEGATIGVQVDFDVTANGFLSVNFTRLFVNASSAEIRMSSSPQANASGVIDFMNSTFVTTPTISITNVSINMTFNNTNFTDNSVSLFFPYFNISTNPTTKTSFVLNRSTFFVNGSNAERYGIISINATNLTELNRSANVSMTGIDCSRYRIFYNQSFFSAISPLRNSSFTVARPSAGFCLSPALCGSIQCGGTTSSMLSFNITGFSSFGVQNNTLPTQPQLLSPTNGNISVFDRRPPFDWDSTDVDGDNVTYNLTTTHGFCPAIAESGINQSNFTPTFNLCTNGDDANPFNWTVVAFDGLDASNTSERFNFTIDAFVTINLTTNVTNFGSKNVTNEDNTTDNDPAPFILQNDGNVFITVRINASQSLWLTRELNTRFFQFKIDNTSSEPNPGTFNVTGTVLTFTNMTNTNMTAIKQINFTDASDTAEIDFLIRVPSDEPAGSKSSIITVIGEFDE